MNLILSTLFLILSLDGLSEAGESGAVSRTTFGDATATFYGGTDAAGTAGGSCGYENPFTRGYGVTTAALSNSLLSDGLNCGACFEVKCNFGASDYTRKYCYNGKSVVITSTNLSPPGLHGEHHFDLTYPMFTQISNMIAGRIPVQYRRWMNAHRAQECPLELNETNAHLAEYMQKKLTWFGCEVYTDSEDGLNHAMLHVHDQQLTFSWQCSMQSAM